MDDYVEIPLDKLAPTTLKAVIESFVLREGTNYGDAEYSLETKTNQVLQQLRRGTIKLVYDPESESPTLITSQ